MNTNELFAMLLKSGQDLIQNGQTAVENKLGVPSSGTERTTAMSNLGKGALAGGLLTLLLGTKGGREIGSKAVELGSLAALAGVAYKAYQGYQAKNAPNNQTASQTEQDSPVVAMKPIENMNERELDNHSSAILKAIIAAAKSDGLVDDNERSAIDQYIKHIGSYDDLRSFVEKEINKPLDPTEFAQYANDPVLAGQIYLASVMVTNKSNFMENAYLAGLAKNMNLNAEIISSLEAQLA